MSGRRPAKERVEAWAAALVLTFFGLFLVAVVGAFVLAYLTPVMRNGSYIVVVAFAAAVSVAIGFVLRWLAQG